MTTFADRPNTALLVIDMQVGVVAHADARDAVTGRIARLIDRARRTGVLLIWVQHADTDLVEGSEPWQLVPELTRAAREPLVVKQHGDAFEESSLDDLLAMLAVGRVIVTGAESDACIMATLHGAFLRGYDVTLVADGHMTDALSAAGDISPRQIIASTNRYWSGRTAPGRRATVMDAKDVDFGSPELDSSRT